MTAPRVQQGARRAPGGTLRAMAGSPAGFLALLAVGCVVAYLPSRNGAFVFDDISNIVENPAVRMTRLDLPSIWQAMVPYGNLNLRPLSFLTFALNHLLGGYAPLGYRLVNLAVLLLSIPVAYLLALRLGSVWMSSREARSTAMGATAIWALHPLLTNGVSYVVQRMTALYALFSLAALLCFLDGRLSGRTRSYVLAAIALLCSLASKETALFTPLLAVLILWFLPRGGEGAAPRAGWALAALVVASQVAMVFAAQYALRVKWVPSQELGMAERLLTEGRVVLRYLELYFLPLPSKLTLDYAFTPSTSPFTPASTLPAAAIHAALIALAVLARRRRPLLAFGVLGFYLLQLPEGTFMPLDLIFEHRTYLPAFFLSLALMDLLRWVAGRRRALGAAVALAALWGAFTHERNQVWTDPEELWEDTVAKAPGNVRAHTNLGLARAAAGNLENAVVHLEAAVRLKPDDVTALYALGGTYGLLGVPEKAIKHLQEAVRLAPGHPFALNNLGRACGELGLLEESAGYYRRAIAAKPDFAMAHFNLGMTLLTLGRNAEAAAVWHTLQGIDPALAQTLGEQLHGSGG